MISSDSTARRIDVHAHYTPPEYIKRMSELGAFDELPVFRILRALYEPALAAGGTASGPDLAAVATRLADMDAGSVDLQIVGLGAAQPYFADVVKAGDAARLANDLMGDFVNLHPDRFGAFGTLPMPHPEESLAELTRCLDELHLSGIGLGCSAAGVPIDDERFDALWAELDARAAVVYIHPGVAIDGIVGCEAHHLAPDFVSPAEIGVCAARLVTAGILARFPKISIILATTGGSLPFFARRFDRGLRQQDPELHERLGGFLPSLERFYYDTSVLEEPLVMRTAFELVGAGRLLLGSDYSRPGVTSMEAVRQVDEADYLSESDKRDILGATAQRIFESQQKRTDQ